MASHCYPYIIVQDTFRTHLLKKIKKYIYIYIIRQLLCNVLVTALIVLPLFWLLTYCPTASGLHGCDVNQVTSQVSYGPILSLPAQDL